METITKLLYFLIIKYVYKLCIKIQIQIPYQKKRIVIIRVCVPHTYSRRRRTGTSSVRRSTRR